MKAVHEKHVIFYSEKYDRKLKSKHTAIIVKAQYQIANTGKYTQATPYGAAGYVKNISFDKKTEEILSTSKALVLYLEKLKEEEALDGYYVIVTSEYEEIGDKIIDIYRGFWGIEDLSVLQKAIWRRSLCSCQRKNTSRLISSLVSRYL